MNTIFVATDLNRLIGINNKIPWFGRPEWKQCRKIDLRNFWSHTICNVVIMGRKTYQSIGRPLPGRINIVLSRSTPENHTDISCISNVLQGTTIFTHSYQRVRNKIPKVYRQFIIGGEEIYRLFLPLTERIFHTEFQAEFDGPGTKAYFPEIEPAEWQRSLVTGWAVDQYRMNIYQYLRTVTPVTDAFDEQSI